MAETKISKFKRPQEAHRGRISVRDLDLIEAILRYRFLPTAELVRLAGGNEDVTHRRLRRLWEWELVNRFAFPKLGMGQHEFNYYIDSRQALETLVAFGRLAEIHPAMLEEISHNREKDYAGAAVLGKHMQLGFLKHVLQISRMHFMLEMAARKSGGRVALKAWHQGSQLRTKVMTPKLRATQTPGGQRLWQETEEEERVPVEPDALFTLEFSGRLVHFAYEADRGTMPLGDMMRKLRGYYQLVKKAQGHKEAFGVHPLRAVLIEAPDEDRALRLMEVARHPLVSGQGKRAGLFWFTISPLFTDPRPGTRIPRYLDQPEVVLEPEWALPDLTKLALEAVENSGKTKSDA